MKSALPSTTPHDRAPSSRRSFAAVGFAAIAIAVAACSGNGTTGSANGVLPALKDRHHSSPPPYTFTFQPVDYANGGNNNRITGIDERSAVVVGLSGNDPSSYSSWTAQTPLPLSTAYRYFKTKNYSGASGTYMATMTSAFDQAGTVFSPPPSGNLQCNACGVIHNNNGSGTGYGTGICGGGPCEWAFFQDPNEGTGNCAVTQITGLSDWKFVVGYYGLGSSDCGTQAFEAYYSASGGEYFADFSVPGADAKTTKATGMNEEGDVVGTALFNGHPQGWFYIEATYCTGLAAPNAIATYPMGLNWEDQVSGYYVDGKNNTHGFLLLNPDAPASNQIWETVDEPSASNYTVVSHINIHHTITGWYQDSYGHLHGFVGTCTGSNCGAGSMKRRKGNSPPRRTSGSSSCIPSGSLKWRKRQ